MAGHPPAVREGAVQPGGAEGAAGVWAGGCSSVRFGWGLGTSLEPLWCPCYDPFFFVSSTSLWLPTHVPPPSRTCAQSGDPWAAARQAPPWIFPGKNTGEAKPSVAYILFMTRPVCQTLPRNTVNFSNSSNKY